ncbi:Fanconi anemia group J protein [Mactra antiquata]
MAELDERTVTISGVKVSFPCKPYPSQFGMMDRVIKGLEKRQNCLLESPTGSGKSLALLCSALAWQVAHQEKLTRENLMAVSNDADCCKTCTCGANKVKTSAEYSPESKPKPIVYDDEEDVIEIKNCDYNDDEDDDFQPTSYRKSISKGDKGIKKRKHLDVKYEDVNKETTTTTCCTCYNDNGTGGGTVKKQKLPKIYFGTRTHKQIAQITRELRKTAYHDVRMVILASREYTCVHPEVTKMKNKNEGCRDRLDQMGPGCKFNDKAKRVFLSQSHIQDELPTAWDLEDFVGSCKSQKACPYFIAKNIKEGAHIVFCPYNYLIDPLVRKSMEINLKDQIVILDEAHNIEDSSRDAASGSVTTEQITNAIENIQQLLDIDYKFADHLKLKNMLDSLLMFIESNNSNLDQQDYNTSYKVWSGFDIVARLKNIGLGPDSIGTLRRSFDTVTQNDDEQVTLRDRRKQKIKLNSPSIQVFELLFQILDYMYREDLKYVEDYRVAIMKSIQYVTNRDTGDRWLGKNRRDFNQCRNVVLSSGTLSPMSSFQSELGVPFPIQLEANHIIDDKQVFVGAIGVGPTGHQLQAVYRNMETFNFQDELGQFILQVCMKVPHGVLCFLPSYRALQKFVERWKLTGLWNKLTSRKRVMVEPRSAHREDFDNMMKAFYDVVKGDLNSSHLSEEDYEDEDDTDIDGALFFAVCRGKVSEGMDFADNNARAVITVGIPFPSIKDVQVKLKREYNDQHRTNRGLLSGNDWYEIQAFRALNQALGRCIRHRKDWGALIIVDDRFVKNTPKYVKSLSRWVRSKVQTYHAFNNFIESMSSFTDKMIKEMPVVNPDTSFIPSTPSSNRRESFYNKSPSGINTSVVQTSQYFRSPPQIESLLRTPDSDHKQNTFYVKGNNSSSPMITSPSLQQQIMNIVNSNTTPKDQAYYVMVNQGMPNEQVFLIQPNNTTNQNSALLPRQPILMQKPAPEMSSQMIVNLKSPGTSANQQVLLQVPPSTQFVPGTRLSQTVSQSAVPGASIQNQNGNQTVTNSNQTVANTNSGNKSSFKQGEIVFTLGPSPLPVKDQLQNFISSGKAPKDKAYYVVTNKGEPTERAFFIDPMKKGSSKNTPAKETGKNSCVKSETSSSMECVTTSTSTDVLSTAVGYGTNLSTTTQDNVLTGTSNTTVSTACGTDNNEVTENKDFTSENKFLKFCHLPKTPTSKVPVATVTPHRPVDIKQECKAEDNESKIVDTSIKVEPDQTDIKPSESRSSPVLFDEPESKTVDKLADVKNVNETTGKMSNTKRPIFKKRASLPQFGKKKAEMVELDEKSKSAVKNLNKKEERDRNFEKMDQSSDIKDNVTKSSDFATKEKNVKKRLSMRGNNDKDIVDKVKQGRDTRDNDKNNEIGHVSAGVSESKTENMGAEENSDEEFLNTRRRGGRKRKTTSKFAEWSKRTKKGVTYDDDEDDVDEQNKENKETGCKPLACCKCDTIWLKSVKCQAQKQTPTFLDGLIKKNTKVLLYETNDKDLNSLIPVTSKYKGVILNTVYSTGCCLEYLQCSTCNTGDIVGVRILLAEPTSIYKPGQVWILSSAIKDKI